jgi:hypothetical protein
LCGIVPNYFCVAVAAENWFRQLKSHQGTDYPGKEALDRFLNHSGYACRLFLTLLSREWDSSLHGAWRTRPLTHEKIDGYSFVLVDFTLLPE